MTEEKTDLTNILNKKIHFEIFELFMENQIITNKNYRIF